VIASNGPGVRPGRLLAVAAAVAALLALVATAVAAPRYTVTVVSSAAGGDPGVLYVGGPMNLELRDARNAREAYRLCITPAPIDQPSCRNGHSATVISGPAPSAAGRTELRFELPGGRTVRRVVNVVSKPPKRIRLLHAAAVYRRPNLGVVVRLSGALPARRRPAVIAAPSLLRGQIFPPGQRFFGGVTPGRIGRSSRHCYAAEARQPEPRVRPRAGTFWKVALSDGSRVREVATATIRTRGSLAAAARRLGCGL
jgi:hypothetical protein